MEKEHRYVNGEEIKLRLHSTIVRYSGRPCMAYWIGQDFDIKINDLVTEEKKIVSTDDPLLDISSPPLGYVNDAKVGPLYMCRQSYRLQKQGIDLMTLVTIDITGEVKAGRNLDHKNIGSALLGEYPTYTDAKKHVFDGATGLAWDRRFAIGVVSKIPLVYYRGTAVGVLDMASDKLQLQRRMANLPVMNTALKEWMKVHV